MKNTTSHSVYVRLTEQPLGRFHRPNHGAIYMLLTALLPLTGVLLQTAGLAAPGTLPTKEDARLIPVYESKRVWNGITLTTDGRAFASFPDADGPGVKLQELTGKAEAHPYPDQSWNAWKAGGDAKTAFVHVNALRIGPDGHLWVVDAGATGIGKPAVQDGAKIVSFDLAKNKVARSYSLASALKPKSYVDDIRFNGGTGYLTDAGEPGLIILNLKTGAVRRVLDGDPSTVDRRAMKADGIVMLDEKGKELRVHADQIEISPDGKYVYYQPASGPLARIETRWLDDAKLSASALASHVENWLDTPTCGGTAIDAKGNIYYGDDNRRAILKIAPDKSITELVADPRLIWTDAMWIDHDGYLWIPAAQLNLSPGFQHGKNMVHYPVRIYKMKIDAKPAPNDHS